MEEFENKVSDELKKYPFLNWKNKKTLKLVRKLFKKGYSISQTVQLVILNN